MNPDAAAFRPSWDLPVEPRSPQGDVDDEMFWGDADPADGDEDGGCDDALDPSSSWSTATIETQTNRAASVTMLANIFPEMDCARFVLDQTGRSPPSS